MWSYRPKRSGVKFDEFLEWILAARWWGLTPDQFFDRDGLDQSVMVAAYRTNAQIEAVMDDERRKESEGREKPTPPSQTGRKGRRR
ncbi:MAG TPA: hypothetical protein P5282_05690 [Anaerolineaceae bacterium]|nr:hypothetical protein [Myxococcota bacterium]HRS74412.1 hypothetical protein [Anaerolineaceae bacterium]HRV17903.1 hypothetical protein [Myxococcota bacterium]